MDTFITTFAFVSFAVNLVLVTAVINYRHLSIINGEDGDRALALATKVYDELEDQDTLIEELESDVEALARDRDYWMFKNAGVV